MSTFFKPARLVSFVFLLAALFGASMAHADSLTASVDRDTLSIQETFTLNLRYSGQSRATPDLSGVRTDFEIINTQQSNQMQVVNGRMTSYTDWRIALAPKKSGSFTIPPITVENATSQAITITVEAQRNAQHSNSQPVFVELETDKDSAYVQEQIIVTIRLFTAVPLNNVDLQPLVLDDAVVTSLDEKQYQTNLNGRPHAVVETRYAVFPQISGKLVIPALSYNVTTGSAQRDMWGQMYGNRNSNLLRLRTEEQTLNVKTIPAEFAGKTWLPASNVSISEHWSSSLDSFKIGEPVTRTLTITADGLTAGQLAPITINPVEGLTLYPDQAQTDDQNTTKGIVGKRIETLAVVPNRGGRFTLPAIDITWWDTASKSVKHATLPETVITVEDNVALRQSSSTGSLEEDTLEFIPHPKPADGKDSAGGLSVLSKAPLTLLIWAIIATVLAVIFAALWWNNRDSAVGDEVSNDAASDSSYWTNLKRANASGDLTALRRAVISWAQHHWQREDLHSLEAIAAHTDNRELGEQLRALDQALYSAAGTVQWDSGLLLQQIYACKREKQQAKKNTGSLKGLYKSR